MQACLTCPELHCWLVLHISLCYIDLVAFKSSVEAHLLVDWMSSWWRMLGVSHAIHQHCCLPRLLLPLEVLCQLPLCRAEKWLNSTYPPRACNI